MSNTDTIVTPSGRTYRTVEMKTRHIWWIIFIAIIVIGALVVGVFYAAGGTVQISKDGFPVVVRTPDLSNLKGLVKVVSPNGDKTLLIQEEPVPDGDSHQVTDGIGPSGKLQRHIVNQSRFDPIDDLSKKISDSNDLLAKVVGAVGKTNESVKDLSGQVGALSGDLAGVKTDVAALSNRVKVIEDRPIASAPAPSAAPAQTAPAPSVSAPALKPQADADGPAPKDRVAAADVAEFNVPDGFHFNGMGDQANKNKAHSCLPPHALEPDMATGKPAGYKDPETGKPVMRYKLKCV